MVLKRNTILKHVQERNINCNSMQEMQAGMQARIIEYRGKDGRSIYSRTVNGIWNDKAGGFYLYMPVP